MSNRIFLIAAALATLAPFRSAAADEIKNPVALFGGLDKITGRTYRFEVKVNDTVQFGTLQIRPRVCYSKPPTEPPQTASFVQVNNLQPNGKAKRIFSGWMFAASPGLNGIQHPVYDVWLLDCKGGTKVIASRRDSGAQPALAATPAKPAATFAKTAAPAPSPTAPQSAPRVEGNGLGPPAKPGVVPPFSGPPIEVGDAPGEGPGAVPPPPPLPSSLRPQGASQGGPPEGGQNGGQSGGQNGGARAPRAGDLY